MKDFNLFFRLISHPFSFSFTKQPLRLFVFLLFFASSFLYAESIPHTDDFKNDNDQLGWTGNGLSIYTYDGVKSLRIDKRGTATKKFSFGPDYRNTTVNITFNGGSYKRWESNDELKILNGDNSEISSHVLNYYLNNDDLEEYTFSTQTNGSGDLTLRLYTNTDKKDEDSYIDWITINAATPSPNTPTISLSCTPSSLNEGDSGSQQVTCTVSIDEAPNTEDLELNFRTRNNSTATSIDNDFNQVNQNFSFSKNTSTLSRTFTITVNGDSNVELDETFNVQVRDDNTDSDQPFNVPAETAITIVNDDVAVNAPPVITSNGGGATASISIAENTTAVTTVQASDADSGDTLTYTISGTDSGLFSIVSASGVLTLQTAGTAGDTYNVTVNVSDGNGGTDSQDLVITVLDSNVDYPCAKPHAFEQRVSYILPGDLIAIGNSNICADEDKDGLCDDDQRKRNDTSNIIDINSTSSTDVENEPATLMNTSAAKLTLPEGAKVKWAGLYWQGEVWDIKTNNTNRTNNNAKKNDKDKTIYSVAIENGADGQARKALANTIQFKVPGGGYQALTGDEHYYIFLKRSVGRGDYAGIERYEMHYQSFKDVTELVENAGAGDYWVADIQATLGKLHWPGVEAAWNLQVIYEYPEAKAKSISINDGYLALYSNASEGDDYADAIGCDTGSVHTGVYGMDISFEVGGFLTPKVPGFDTDLSLFLTESDPEPDSSTETLTITKKDGSSYQVDGTNAWNYEITNKDGSDNLDRTPAYIYPIGMTIKNYRLRDALDTDQSSTSITFTTDSDKLILGVIGFSTELRAPDLCYDYAYKQNGRYFTEDNNGSYDPRIIGDGLSTSDDITVELFIQNTEESDIIAQNMTVNILDINTTQATYISPSTYVIRPDEVFPVLYTDTNATASYNRNILIGDIDSKDFFYLDYDLDLLTSNIDMPLNASIEYTAVFPYGNSGQTIEIDYSAYLNNTIPLCTDDNFAYNPTYANFNVENSILSQTQKYNLPTQTANRAGDFVVTSYDVDQIHTRVGISTPVAIELIDAGKYHSVDASCREPDSALTPRVWVIFDNNVSVIDFDYDTITSAIANGTISNQISGGTTPIATAEEFYGVARENVAFRIGFNRAGDGGEIIQLAPGRCQGQQIAPCVEVLNFPDLSQVDLDGDGPLRAGDCIQDIDGRPTNTDKIPQNCGNAGNAGMDSVQLATCMECIYGHNIDFQCSRDNFAIRPESFRMTLKDQDQNDNTQQSDITTNNDTTLTHASNNELQVVAGYDYVLDINATNHQNDDNTPGYYASFLLDENGSNRSIRLNWETSADDTKCNDIEDQNQTATFFNGTASTLINSPQVGNYTLTLMDRLWTQVDHDPAYMGHHTTGDGAGYFLTTANSDCIDSSSVVPVQNASTSSYTEDVSGCDITTNNDSLTPKYHTNTDTSDVYTDIALRIHPYQFNHAGVIPAIGPYTRLNGQTFIYMDTPPILNANNANMSYNMNGTFFAAGYDNTKLTNFVTGCYADDINMDLNYTYNSPLPTQAPYLWYSIKNYNFSNSTIVYRPSSGPDDFERPVEPTANTIPLSTPQGEGFFAKDMNGSITMDLGYNFKRDYNNVQNPRYIEFKDFNITYNINPTSVRADLKSDHQIFGNKVLDTNVTFVYGKAKSSKYFYDDVITNSINTPISIVVYCDQDPITCSAVYNIETVLSKTEEFDWYLSRGHVMTPDNDGNITLIADNGAAVTSPVVINNSGGVDPNVAVSDGGVTTRPLEVNIDFGTATNRWLIHNEDANVIPSPFYRVRFIGQSDWAGHGDTGHVVESDSSDQKNRRLGW